MFQWRKIKKKNLSYPSYLFLSAALDIQSPSHAFIDCHNFCLLFILKHFFNSEHINNDMSKAKWENIWFLPLSTTSKFIKKKD